MIFGIYSHLNVLAFSYLKEGLITKKEIHILPEKGLSAELPSLVAHFLNQDSPKCIALQRGPSGFTSLRVTLAYVQGLSLGWQSKLFTPTHFDLLKEHFNIQNGTIIIDHKGAILPGVVIKDTIQSTVKPFSKEDLNKDLVYTTDEQHALNLSTTL
ncbi:MAG: hypothetical protein KBD31_03525, partial [Proteobacteria bacterium]|nr:hypothetical protein [Pseudomonadota bacterium]